MNDDPSTRADLARFTEGLQQAEAELLSGHLDEAKGRDLSYLVLRPIPAQTFHQAT